MCHSPSGALRVQAPDRAAWALADDARATNRPAAIPPDSTFCVKRFITDLRMKGDSTALLQSVACCQLGDCGCAPIPPEHRMVGSEGLREWVGEWPAAASSRRMRIPPDFVGPSVGPRGRIAASPRRNRETNPGVRQREYAHHIP